MKTAVCFTGQCRALEITHENIKKNLLEPLGDADVFMYISENSSSDKAHMYMDPTEIIIEPDPSLDLTNINHMQAEERGGINGYMQMLYGMKKCNEMRKNYEKKNNFQYDRIVRSRLDVKYFNKIPTDFDEYNIEDYIYIPDFHCWSVVQGHGYNDRFAVGSRNNMNIYLSEYDFIKKYSLLKHVIHAESTLYYHLNHHNIKVKQMPIRFTRIRAGGVEEDLHINSPPHLWPPEERY